MYNPTRRNKNIGTSNQGIGQNNKLTIPEPYNELKTYYERLVDYQKLVRVINDHEFIFVIEKTRSKSVHSCSIGDVETMIAHIPREDYGDMKFIVLRQPKRKEVTLMPVWGRLVYSFEFEGEYHPAIILEAVDLSKKLKWSSKLSIDSQKELNRLKEDGHNFVFEGRHYIADYEIQNIRNTQLYRTFLHEFGHYVHYLETVERPREFDEIDTDRDSREDKYFTIPEVEKEKYAHSYADQLRSELTKKKIIPFDPI